VTMILTRRRFLTGRITCRWSPPKPRKLTREEKHELSQWPCCCCDAYGSKRGRVGVIIEM
jgi:hypothetical protein